MKIRSDFVTNSSSSSFITITLRMKDGSEILDEIVCDDLSYPGVGLFNAEDLSEVINDGTSDGEALLRNLEKLYEGSPIGDFQISDRIRGDDGFGGKTESFNIMELKDLGNVAFAEIKEKLSGDESYNALENMGYEDPNEPVVITMTYDTATGEYTTEKVTEESGMDVSDPWAGFGFDEDDE